MFYFSSLLMTDSLCAKDHWNGTWRLKRTVKLDRRFSVLGTGRDATCESFLFEMYQKLI